MEKPVRLDKFLACRRRYKKRGKKIHTEGSGAG